VNLISLAQGANSWLGVEATGINLSLALDPLSVSVSGGELKLNRAAGAGTHKLDWKSFTEAGAGAPLGGWPRPHLDIASSLDLDLAGTVAVELAGVFTATAAGSVDLGQLTDGAVGGTANYTAVNLTASAGGGGAAAGATVHLVSITNGAKSWLGVD